MKLSDKDITVTVNCLNRNFLNKIGFRISDFTASIYPNELIEITVNYDAVVDAHKIKYGKQSSTSWGEYVTVGVTFEQCKYYWYKNKRKISSKLEIEVGLHEKLEYDFLYLNSNKYQISAVFAPENFMQYSTAKTIYSLDLDNPNKKI